MTPERQQWWNSLPMEEKRVRLLIKTLKGNINCCKQTIADEWTAITNDGKIGKNQLKAAQENLCDTKRSIKALRKQIGMRPVSNFRNDMRCPCCNKIVWRWQPTAGRYLRRPPEYCEQCGQKLRWY